MSSNQIQQPVKSLQTWIYLPNVTVVRTDNNLMLSSLKAATQCVCWQSSIHSLSLRPWTNVLPSHITIIMTNTLCLYNWRASSLLVLSTLKMLFGSHLYHAIVPPKQRQKGAHNYQNFSNWQLKIEEENKEKQHPPFRASKLRCLSLLLLSQGQPIHHLF